MEDKKLTNSELKNLAIRSVKWTTLGEIASRSIQPLVMLILARLLAPSDFGVIGVAMIAIGLAQIFQDFGLGKTLIQRETDVEQSANIVFWTNLALSLLIYLIIFFTAPLISVFFHEPKVIDVLRVLCLLIVSMSFITVHQALFQRSFQFKKLFFIRLASAAVPGCVSIPLALLGYGVWSLVFGTLAGSIFQVLLYWKTTSWRPKFNYNFHLAKQLFGFSSWVVTEAFLGWIIMWGDSIILGHFLGVKELGIYRVGITFVMLIFGTLFNPVLSISYTTFSRLQADQEKLVETFLKLVKVIAFVAIPLGVGIFMISSTLSAVIFGTKWSGIETVIALLGVMHAVGWLVGINPEMYRAIGRPDVEPKRFLFVIIYYIPVCVLAAPYGLYSFCLARLAITVIGTLSHFWAVKKVLYLPFTYITRFVHTPLAGSLIAGSIVYLISTQVNYGQGIFGLAIALTAGGLGYIMILGILERGLVTQAYRLAKDIIS